MPEIELRRETLYEEVWEVPVSRLAEQYGLSDVGLRKICKKLGVPTPPRGYWAKLRHGYDVKPDPLPACKEDQPTTHTICVRTEGTAKDKEADSSVDQSDEEKLPFQVPKIDVAQRLQAPHRLVNKTQAALEEARPDTYGKVQPNAKGTLPLSVHPTSVNRALCILDALVKAAKQVGYPVKAEKERSGRAHLTVEGEEIAFRLSERFQRKEPPAHEERSFWDPKYDYVPTGEFALKLVDLHGTGRKKWSDGKTQKVEELLGSFLVGAYKAALAEKEWRKERKEWRRRWEEKQRQRREAEKHRREEEKRRRALEEQAQRWKKSEQLRAYIREVERRGSRRDMTTEKQEAFGRWLTWAREHADRLDPLSEDLPFEQHP